MEINEKLIEYEKRVVGGCLMYQNWDLIQELLQGYKWKNPICKKVWEYAKDHRTVTALEIAKNVNEMKAIGKLLQYNVTDIQIYNDALRILELSILSVLRSFISNLMSSTTEAEKVAKISSISAYIENDGVDVLRTLDKTIDFLKSHKIGVEKLEAMHNKLKIVMTKYDLKIKRKYHQHMINQINTILGE